MLHEEYLDWQNLKTSKPYFNSVYITAIAFGDNRWIFEYAKWDEEKEFFYQDTSSYGRVPLQNVTHWYLIGNLPNPTNF